jgi:hypothetical protein
MFQRSILASSSGSKIKPIKKPTDAAANWPQPTSSFYWLIAWLTRLLWRWRQYVPPKRPASSELHVLQPRSTVRFIVTAVITSSPTINNLSPCWCGHHVVFMGALIVLFLRALCFVDPIRFVEREEKVIQEYPMIKRNMFHMYWL